MAGWSRGCAEEETQSGCMKLLGREQEVLVTAPTGNAAEHVQGSRIHTGLDVGVRSQ
jgi:hypothetical protein